MYCVGENFVLPHHVSFVARHSRGGVIKVGVFRRRHHIRVGWDRVGRLTVNWASYQFGELGVVD